MCRLLAFCELLPFFQPVEPFPDAIKLGYVTAHNELAGRDVDHLRAVDRVRLPDDFSFDDEAVYLRRIAYRREIYRRLEL